MTLGLEPFLDRTLGGRYRLRALIGVGATAAVYVADDERLGRPVAVKILHAGLLSDPRFRNRFRAEAQASAQLSHPHVVAVFDWSDLSVGPGGPEPAYLVTELLTGGSLREVMDNGRLTLSQVVMVGLDVGTGLRYAHQCGLVHRDVKPANLLLGADGRVRIADFGIARAVAEATWTEPEGALVGTARYAAPEQAGGGPVDGRADVYALAVTLIEAATGEVPLAAPTALATMLARQDTDVPVPPELGPLVPVLEAAGRADPAQRSTAEEFITGLRKIASGLPRPEPLDLPGIEERPLVSAPAGRGPVSGLLDTTRPGEATSVLNIAGPEPAIDLGGSDDRRRPPAPEVAPAVGPAEDHDAETRAPVDDTVGVPDRPRWALVVAAAIVLAGLIAFGVRGLVLPGDDAGDTTPAELLVVGNYVGRTAIEAQASIAQAGWRATTTFNRADGFAAGSVIRQSPSPGVRLAADEEVTLVVSEGFVLRDVPLVEGLPLADALAALRAVGLRAGRIDETHSETVPFRAVVSVSSAPGTQLETGATVDLVWSLGPAPRVLPDPDELTVDELVAALEADGLVVMRAEDYSEEVPEGELIAMSPAAGATVARDSEVTVTVSLGLPFVTVPDVVGRRAPDAAEILTAAGLEVVDTEGPPNREVLATSPPAGESVRKGTDIVIFTRH